MQKRYIYLIIGVLLTTASCKKNFLDRFPQTAITPELFFNTEEDLALYVNGLLSLTGSGAYFDDQYSDNMATTGNIEIKSIMTGSPSSQNITSGWDTTNWKRLRDINYFLDNYDKAKVTQDIKDHYAGLARYYRAAFYFDKVKRYSDVPWYSHALTPDNPELYKGRDPRAQVMDSVMADLLFSTTHVREDVPSGMPGLWAARVMYARVALYEGTYRKYHPELNLQNTAGRFLDTAATVALTIMNSGKFGITPGYATLFNSQDLLSNNEVILAHPYDPNKGGDASNSSNINSTVFGDYEQSPSRDLVQTYLMKDGTRFTDIPGYDKFLFVKEFQNRDPRMLQTLAYPGFMRAQDTKPYIQRLNKNFTGYHQLKGYINTTDNTTAAGVDFPVFRYAEVLLTRAEALAEQDKLTQDDLDKTVNLLRSRAAMPAMNLAAAVASPDPVLAAQYPDVSGSQKGALLEIRRERRVEFAMEGYRYDDLMRWHAGRLLTKIPEGMYFPGLGKYDLTGDGVEDIILIDRNSSIPAEEQKEKNSLGVTLVYYKAGAIGDNVTVYMKNGNSGGTLVTETAARTFIEPKYYYRPIPFTQVALNPALKQIFGWD